MTDSAIARERFVRRGTLVALTAWLAVAHTASATELLLSRHHPPDAVRRYDYSGTPGAPLPGAGKTGALFIEAADIPPALIPVAQFKGVANLGSNLFMANQDTNQVLRFQTSTGKFVGTFNTVNLSQLNSPNGIMVHSDNTLFISGYISKNVARYNAGGTFLQSYSNVALNGPIQSVIGPNGNLFVLNHDDGLIGQFTLAGSFLGVFASTGFAAPSDLALGPDGNLYSARGNVVKKIDTTSALVSTFISDASLLNASGLTFGPDGNLYVSSPGNTSVRKYNGSTGAFISTFVSDAASMDPSSGAYITFVPEPGVAAMLMVGAGAMLLRRRARLQGC